LNKFEIEIPLTSRYFTHGELSSRTKFIWIACHGYGQLAQYFIKKFEILDEHKHFVIAPEGINRFYLTGFSGRVGATWMTKEDRETDIVNYCKQLSAILHSINKKRLKQVKLNLFGFSQGTATISRWMEKENIKCENLILWAGKLAHELELKKFRNLFNKGYFLFGSEDEFSSKEEIQKYLSSISESGLSLSFIPYIGMHAVDSEILKEISSNF